MTNPFDPCFLSIDVEAQDLEVLMSNNFSQFNPRVIIIEDMEYNIREKMPTTIIPDVVK
jgi:hypothetical protein